jgi:hypothetical protein
LCDRQLVATGFNTLGCFLKEELTERVQEMATDGYSEATEDIVELMAVDAFLKGCNDKKTGLAAMDENPSRIDNVILSFFQVDLQTFPESGIKRFLI